MPRNIAAYTAPGLAPDGRVAPYVSINRSDDGAYVAVHARDADGREVSVAVPSAAWRSMKGQIFREPGF